MSLPMKILGIFSYATCYHFSHSKMSQFYVLKNTLFYRKCVCVYIYIIKKNKNQRWGGHSGHLYSPLRMDSATALTLE
jgi:hypothetical protein